MTTIEEKQTMKVLNYYNEYSNFQNDKYLYFEKLCFLGIEYVADNQCLRFQLENGLQIRRQIMDTLYYEHVPRENDDKITDEDKKNIFFLEIKNEDKKEDKE
jgi:hypothetical protein